MKEKPPLSAKSLGLSGGVFTKVNSAKDCLFCRIVSGEIPSQKVFENQRVSAFKDINPVAPVHILVIPNEHIESVADVTSEHQMLLGELIVAAKEVADALDLTKRGFRLVVNAGVDGGQTVPHLHFHLLGGRELTWPPG